MSCLLSEKASVYNRLEPVSPTSSITGFDDNDKVRIGPNLSKPKTHVEVLCTASEPIRQRDVVLKSQSSFSSDSTIRNDTNPDESVFIGHICAFNIYRIWKEPRTLTDSLNALCSLLIKRYEGAWNYSVEYVFITFPVKLLVTSWELGENTTATSLSVMANDAATSTWEKNSWPNTLHRPNAWKALYCTAYAYAKSMIGFEKFYHPLQFRVSKTTGLILAAHPISPKLLRNINRDPNVGILNIEDETEVKKELNTSTFNNAVGRKPNDKTPATTFACMYVLRNTYKNIGENSNHPFRNSCYRNIPRVRIVTKETSQQSDGVPIAKRLYIESGPSSIAIENNRDDLDKIAIIDERCILLPSEGTNVYIRVRSLIPIAFDCLVIESDIYSAESIMSVYAEWYSVVHLNCEESKVHSTKKAKYITPIFRYIGSELFPEREDKDYAFFIGFPGWQILKPPKPEKTIVQETIESYVCTDGLWPLAGSRTFAALGPVEEWLTSTEQLSETIKYLSSVKINDRYLGELSEQWPSGRIKCAFPSCTAIRNACIAKMDFSAFIPTLFSTIYSKNIHLTDIIKARHEHKSLWSKRPTVEFCGNEKKHRPHAYSVAMMIANGIAEIVESTAVESGFAICTFMKDGFWGILVPTENDAPFTPEQIKATIEHLRTKLELAANSFVDELSVLKFPNGVKLSLRIEGIYTDAVSWNCNCYYLVNRNDLTQEDFIGFPSYNTFAMLAKNETANLIRDFLTNGLNTHELINAAETTCHKLLETAFICRTDANVWKLSSFQSDRKSQLDIISSDGTPLSIKCAAFNNPLIVPAIDCEKYASSTFATLIRLINTLAKTSNNISETRLENDTYPLPSDSTTHKNESITSTNSNPTEIQFSLHDFSFLFTKNK